jgi:RNA polymerase sigma-70 factor, ECF subfamily
VGHGNGCFGCIFFVAASASSRILGIKGARRRSGEAAARSQIKCNRREDDVVLLREANLKVNASEDQADVARVRGGDVAAFGDIVRRWQGPLINMAYRFCRDRGRAEDMAQEAFLRAYRGLAQWRGDSAFSTWLFALAANLYRTEIRRIPVKSVPLESIAEPRDPGPVDGGFEDEDRERVVRGALSSLPPKYREALTLFYFHDMDVRAAAASLGLSEGTVKARLFRGRELMRSKLESAFASARLKEA